MLLGGIVISEALWTHQQTACQKSSRRHHSVLKHSQQLLIRAIFTSTNELGGEKNSPAIPGLGYIGSNHNLSNSRRRSLEYLRGVTDRNEPRLQLLEKKKKKGHQREADLRLINCRHEGVQGDDDESIWNNRRTNTTWLKIFWLTLSTSVGASSTITSHSITMAIRSIYFVQKVDSTFIYSTIVKIFNRSPPIIFYLILKNPAWNINFFWMHFILVKWHLLFFFSPPRDARPVTFHQTLRDVLVNGPRSGKMCVKESRTFSDAPCTYINVSMCAQLFQYRENRQK